MVTVELPEVLGERLEDLAMGKEACDTTSQKPLTEPADPRRARSSERRGRFLPEAREADSDDLWPGGYNRRYTMGCRGYGTACFFIHAGTRAVEMLPRTTCSSRFHHSCALRMELLLVFDQHSRKLSCTNRHAYCLQKVQDLWLAHPICIVERQDPCPNS
jgi:hypothetical protein